MDSGFKLINKKHHNLCMVGAGTKESAGATSTEIPGLQSVLISSRLKVNVFLY